MASKKSGLGVHKPVPLSSILKKKKQDEKERQGQEKKEKVSQEKPKQDLYTSYSEKNFKAIMPKLGTFRV